MAHLFDSFLTVGQQVVGLFVLVCIGALCGKKGILTLPAVRSCAELVLLLATPCVIIQSFERENKPEMLLGLLFSGLAALAVHGLGIAAAHLSFRGEEARDRVLRFGVVFSNAGYMAIPLQEALLGEEGVFYGAAYVAVFNLVLWSYGVLSMSGDRSALSARKLILNPGVIGLAAGVASLLHRDPAARFFRGTGRASGVPQYPFAHADCWILSRRCGLKKRCAGQTPPFVHRSTAAGRALADTWGSLPLRDARGAVDGLCDCGKRSGSGGYHHVFYPL